MALQGATRNTPMRTGGMGNPLLMTNEAEQSEERNGNNERQKTSEDAVNTRSSANMRTQETVQTTTGANERRNINREENEVEMGTSTQRKRSRVVEREVIGGHKVDKYGIGKTMKTLQEIVLKLGKAGISSGVGSKEINDVFNNLTLQILEMTTAMLNMQEEKTALMDQLIAAQQTAVSTTGANVIKTTGTATYLQTAQKGLAKAVAAGTCLPPPVLSEITKHVPAEKVILYKAETKGELPTKAEQEVFRGSIKNIIGHNEMSEVSAIRPTRLRGYTIIFRSEESRDKAMEKITSYQEQTPEGERKQRIIAPKKKVVKIVCREPPIGCAHSQILEDFYGKHNPLLMQVNRLEQQAKIFETRLGWVFELSASEAAAVEGQGNRIRYGCGHEMRVEEFIPLQQCYRCCLFGHSANECTSLYEHCRLCGKQGHSGKDCLQKETREAWRCDNCMWNNVNKGTNLPIDHAAAQLHECAIAQNEKTIRKSQLATAGVFTTPHKPFMPKTQGGLPPATTQPNENKDVRKSPISTATVGGQVGRRRTPSLQLARCYVPPATAASASSSVKNVVPKKTNDPIQVRPSVTPATKYGQPQGGRGAAWTYVGRGRGRET